MRSACVLILLASAAHAGWGSPKSRKLAAGDLGIVRLVKNDKKVVLDVYFPREWIERDVKAGTKINVTEELVLADAKGVFYRGPAPVFVGVAECENDGGVYVEPIGRLELDPAKLIRPIETTPFGSERNIGLATLGKSPRTRLETQVGRRTLLRVDLDGDGAVDAELRSAPADAGCGSDLKEEDLHVVTASGFFRARCCGP